MFPRDPFFDTRARTRDEIRRRLIKVPHDAGSEGFVLLGGRHLLELRGRDHFPFHGPIPTGRQRHSRRSPAPLVRFDSARWDACSPEQDQHCPSRYAKLIANPRQREAGLVQLAEGVDISFDAVADVDACALDRSNHRRSVNSEPAGDRVRGLTGSVSVDELRSLRIGQSRRVPARRRRSYDADRGHKSIAGMPRTEPVMASGAWRMKADS